VETIWLTPPEMQGAPAHQLEVIGEKVSYRLAQRPDSHVVLKYVRPVAPTLLRHGTDYKLA
jgi:transposase